MAPRSSAAEERVADQRATPTPEASHSSVLKSLFGRLRLSGGKLKHREDDASDALDTPLDQQQRGAGRVAVSPFEYGHGKSTDPKPAPSSQPPHTFTSAASPALATSSTAVSGALGPAGPVGPTGSASHCGGSGELSSTTASSALLGPQPSWGSPRSSDAGGVGAAAGTSQGGRHGSAGGGSASVPRTSSAGGSTGTGTGGGSAGGAPARRQAGHGHGSRAPCASRPPAVPPLDLGRLRDEGGRRTSAAAAPAAAGAHGRPPALPATEGPCAAQGGASEGGAGGAAQAHLGPGQAPAAAFSLAELAELEDEVAAWAAPPRWNPSNQGRWHVYPPIGRQDVAPVETLVQSLPPEQGASVVLLWRQYAAARYSCELMAGRAVRLVRELTKELAAVRDEGDEREEQLERMGRAVMQLQHQLYEAQAAAAAAQEPYRLPHRHPGQQHGYGNGYDDSPPSPTRHRSSSVPPEAGAPPGRDADSDACAPGSAAAAAAAAAATSRALEAENEALAFELHELRGAFMEVHEDSRALRAALEEADATAAALSAQAAGLRRHSAAVLRENEGLRRELSAARTALAAAGAAGGGQPLTAGAGVAAAGTPPPQAAAGPGRSASGSAGACAGPSPGPGANGGVGGFKSVAPAPAARGAAAPACHPVVAALRPPALPRTPVFPAAAAAAGGPTPPSHASSAQYRSNTSYDASPYDPSPYGPPAGRGCHAEDQEPYGLDYEFRTALDSDGVFVQVEAHWPVRGASRAAGGAVALEKGSCLPHPHAEYPHPHPHPHLSGPPRPPPHPPAEEHGTGFKGRLAAAAAAVAACPRPAGPPPPAPAQPQRPPQPAAMTR
ncbi:hypothetical protein HYH03_011557 [Edaphochlamys debaryana]|uniref:Uncharacterized protein n=1 Tax=Edaphochlamys debaryana TaxID=47281 RepID=A0A835XX09_9CHLO|nr:hypothetical protein HYH03_011557 [Edaphochlamys debaryana]|eukprot:KAG2489921.1 hypothetical protein HYH03_011557 [Edaphochlamys debaryana]